MAPRREKSPNVGVYASQYVPMDHTPYYHDPELPGQPRLRRARRRLSLRQTSSLSLGYPRVRPHHPLRLSLRRPHRSHRRPA